MQLSCVEGDEDSDPKDLVDDAEDVGGVGRVSDVINPHCARVMVV